MQGTHSTGVQVRRPAATFAVSRCKEDCGGCFMPCSVAAGGRGGRGRASAKEEVPWIKSARLELRRMLRCTTWFICRNSGSTYKQAD